MAKMGRPEHVLNWQTLNAVLQYGASLTDCAEFCECSEDTIQKNIKQTYQMSFVEYRKRKMAKTRIAIVRKQIEKALAGDNTMLIWTGKNLCDQSDKFSAEVTETEHKKITFAYTIPGNKFEPKPDSQDVEAESKTLPEESSGE